jgi:uncharacterized membrane protein
MDAQSIGLLVVIVLGGLAVLASYVGGTRRGGGAAALWGGVPERIRPAYVASMLLSVIGYFGVLYYVFFKLAPGEVVIGGRPGFALFFPIFLLILVPSALWLPLTRFYVEAPGKSRWTAIRLALFVVGLASIALIWVLFALETDERGVAYWFAAGGSCYFAFHTFVLDALVWAAVSKRH